MEGKKRKKNGTISVNHRLDSRKFAHMLQCLSDNDGLDVDLDNGNICQLYRSHFVFNGLRVDFTTANYHFGGSITYFFVCPFCERRCLYLYLRRLRGLLYPLCQRCGKMNYSSQQQSKFWSAVDATNKQLQRMGIDTTNMTPGDIENFAPPRQKFKHKRKYLENLEKLRRLQENIKHQWQQWGLRNLRHFTLHEAQAFGIIPYEESEL